MTGEGFAVRENKTNGRAAQLHNIKMAKTVANTVKSTLGPKGMDKMLIDGLGNVIVTNDGATILQEMDAEHPAAKIIVEMADTQESMCYDGTTTTVVLCGNLLSNSESLFERGLHPNVICRGYHQASKWAIEHLDSLAIPVGEEITYLTNVAKTAVTGKALENSMEHISQLCVDAIQFTNGSRKSIRVLGQPGGNLDESYLSHGVILHKDFILDSMSKTQEGPILLLNTGLQPTTDSNLKLQLSSAQEAISYRKTTQRDELIDVCNAIIEAGFKTIFVRDGVSEMVASHLSKNDVSVARRISESDMNAISQLTGAEIYHEWEDWTNENASTNGTVTETEIGDRRYIQINVDEPEVVTLVLRGATKQTLAETERGFDDAIGVVSLAYNKGWVVAGGGSAYLNMAMHLRSLAAEVGGREQMAVEAFAEALEAIPGTIAENAGYDSLDMILALRNAHVNGQTDAGPDIQTGTIISMRNNGVYEPLHLVKNAIQSASEVTDRLLRIDDIIQRRTQAE